MIGAELDDLEGFSVLREVVGASAGVACCCYAGLIDRVEYSDHETSADCRPRPLTQHAQVTRAAAREAEHEDIENVCVTVKAPLEAGPEDVQACDAILLGTTENLGYMSGALRDFDRSYYPVLEEKQGLPCAIYIAGHDGTGTSGQWRPLSQDYAGTGCRIHWCYAATGKMRLKPRWRSWGCIWPRGWMRGCYSCELRATRRGEGV